MKKTSLILLCSALLGFVLYFYAAEPVAVDQILAWQPENLYLAAGVLLCGYALKSITVLFPMMILQIVVGHIYSRETAIFLNLLGLIIIASVPYLIGRTLGAEKDAGITLEICQQITASDCKTSFFGQLAQDILRLFAPLI